MNHLRGLELAAPFDPADELTDEQLQSLATLKANMVCGTHRSRSARGQWPAH